MMTEPTEPGPAKFQLEVQVQVQVGTVGHQRNPQSVTVITSHYMHYIAITC